MSKQISVFLFFVILFVSCGKDNPYVPAEKVNVVPLSRYDDRISEKVELTGEAEYSLTNHQNQEDGHLYICLFAERFIDNLGWNDYYCMLRITKDVVSNHLIRMRKIRNTPAQFVVIIDGHSLSSGTAIVTNFELESGYCTTLKNGMLMFSAQDKDNLFFKFGNLKEHTDDSHFPNKYFFNNLKEVMETLCKIYL